MKTKLLISIVLCILLIASIFSQSPSISDGATAAKNTNTNTEIGKEKQNIGDKVNSDLKPEDVQVNSNVEDKSVQMMKSQEKTTLESETDFTLKTKKPLEQESTNPYNEYKGFEKNSDGKNPSLELDEKGQVVGANFKVAAISDDEKTQNGQREYVFGNQRIELPQGAEFSLKDNIADITMPKDSKLIPPQKVAEKKEGEEGITFNYLVKEGELELPQGNKLKADEKSPGIIRYQDEQAYLDFTDKTNINDVAIEGLGIEGISREKTKDLYKFSNTPDKELRTNVFFDGKNHAGNAITLDNGDGKKLMSIATGENSFHTLNFQKNNPYVKMEDGQHLEIQPRENSRIDITNDAKSKPSISVYGHNAQIELGDKKINFAIKNSANELGETQKVAGGIYLSKIQNSNAQSPNVDLKAFDSDGKPLISPSEPFRTDDSGRVVFDKTMSFGEDKSFTMPGEVTNPPLTFNDLPQTAAPVTQETTPGKIMETIIQSNPTRPQVQPQTPFSLLPNNRPLAQIISDHQNRKGVSDAMFSNIGRPLDEKHTDIALEFSATWCGPCRQASPQIHQLGNSAPNIKVVPLDGDKYPDLAAKYGVTGFPSMVIIDAKTGQVKQTYVGGPPIINYLKSVQED